MHLLVTRPEVDAKRTAQVLRARGHAVSLAPVLHIVMIDAPLGNGPFAALVMTSANAARAIERHARGAELRTLPVFTVGAHTEAAARAAGFARVTSADGGLPDLVRLIAAELPLGRLLYLAAEDRAGDLAGDLAAHGFTVDTHVIYRMIANPALPQDLRGALHERLDGVLHYSRRSAEIFLAGARTAGVLETALALTHYCLSDDIAASLRAAGAGMVKIAAQPNEAALMELL
jgi:uroporphyrinogen-III synthase